MKRVCLLGLCVLLAICSQAQTADNSAYAEKVKTLDAIIETLYGVISGDAGVKRDWELFRYLFTDGAKLIPSGKNKEGKITCRYLTPDDYVEQSGDWLEKNGFHEVEVHRTTETFGSVTQVFSAYEAFKNKSDQEPFMRGTNSIQLMNDGSRWWIINIYWVQESEENKLPKFAEKEEYQKVEEACLNYLEGFYEGDTTKLITALKPTLHKFGFWKNKDNGQYELDSYMTFEQAKSYAKRVAEKKRFARADAPKIVEVLDVKNNIAAALVTAFWGVDYILLSKVGDKWMIEQVLWEGPLEN